MRDRGGRVDLHVVPGVRDEHRLDPEPARQLPRDPGPEVGVAGAEHHADGDGQPRQVRDAPATVAQRRRQVSGEPPEGRPGGDEVAVQRGHQRRARRGVADEPADLPGEQRPVEPRDAACDGPRHPPQPRRGVRVTASGSAGCGGGVVGVEQDEPATRAGCRARSRRRAARRRRGRRARPGWTAAGRRARRRARRSRRARCAGSRRACPRHPSRGSRRTRSAPRLQVWGSGGREPQVVGEAVQEHDGGSLPA